MTDLETFISATIEALYFTDTGEENQPTNDAELADETLERLRADCTSFWYRISPFLDTDKCINAGNDAAQAGHDFWLTRNGHGAGFWDGDWPEPYGDMLTNIAKSYGEFETYASDDGFIYS